MKRPSFTEWLESLPPEDGRLLGLIACAGAFLVALGVGVLIFS